VVTNRRLEWVQNPTEVNRLSPSDRFIIARHSPELSWETGLLNSAAEKKREVWAEWRGQSILSGPVYSKLIVKYGRISHLSAERSRISL
jgi:hypothetical protein